jgi:N-acetyltransferase
MTAPVLTGIRVRLEPLELRHIAGLAAASAENPDVYRWTMVPQGDDEARRYVERALELAKAGRVFPFATVRANDGVAIGSTRFFDCDRWAWPEGKARGAFDTCEIGFTWLAASAQGTGANTEAKLLMLTHAFETWGVQSVCFHTDARNERSRAALAGIGATFEGVLRSHRLASDFIPRDSARYAIVAADWPNVKEALTVKLRA